MCSWASPAAPPERSDLWKSGAQEGATPFTPDNGRDKVVLI